MLTAGFEHYKPAIVILIGTDTVMRYLPQQNFEVVLGARRIDLLGDVSTAFGIAAQVALVKVSAGIANFYLGKVIVHRPFLPASLSRPGNNRLTLPRHYLPRVDNCNASLRLEAVTSVLIRYDHQIAGQTECPGRRPG